MVLEYSYKHRLRQKEIAKLSETLNANLGTAVFTENDNVETASLRGFDAKKTYDIIFVDNALIGIFVDGRPMLTVKGLLKYGATKRFVTVDMGAVPYVCNGADIMTPGIVDADPGIAPGDFVWVRDEKNRKPLAIGEALLPGLELKSSKKGKGVKMVHRVGDDLWAVE
jgi:PUA-domain protein